MKFIMTQGHWTIVATIAASIAACAATVQSYVSWQGRNDVLKATLVSATIQNCGDVSAAITSYAFQVAGNRLTGNELVTETSHLMQKLVGMQSLWNAIGPRLSFYATVNDDVVALGQTVKPAEEHADQHLTIDERQNISDEAVKLSEDVQRMCQKLMTANALNLD